LGQQIIKKSPSKKIKDNKLHAQVKINFPPKNEKDYFYKFSKISGQYNFALNLKIA
jgi:hypothetical protein